MTSRFYNVTITGPEGAENVFGGKISPKGFDVLGAQPALGRVFRDEEFQAGAAPVAVLSDRLWSRRFGRDPERPRTADRVERDGPHDRRRAAGRTSSSTGGTNCGRRGRSRRTS